MTADSPSRRAPETARELLGEMRRWPIFDPHSHIDPHRPAARDLDEVLGYHYYTELAHSSGMPAADVAADLPPAPAPRTSPAGSRPWTIRSSIPG